MKNNNYSSVLGNIYLIFKQERFLKSQNDFFTLLGYQKDPSNIEPHIRSNFFNYDCYDASSNLLNIDNLKDRINSILINHPVDTDRLNNVIKNIITEYAEKYAPAEYRWDRSINKHSLVSYNSSDKEKLLMFYKLKNNNYDLAYNFFLSIHFALYKTLPKDFFWGLNYRYDLEEFNQKIINLYGATSNPSVRAIISLAERPTPNIVALYEYAEMFYYGNANGISKDIKRAFSLYESASGISKLSNMPDETGTLCHPLALWALSYVYFNYHKKNTDLEKCATIPKIEDMDYGVRLELAIIYAKASYLFLSSAPAANILGRILLTIETSDKQYYKLKEKYKLDDYEKYFEFAIKHEYVYSMNTMAMIESEKIFSDKNNKLLHLNKCIDHLKQSANKYEPWACNTLGEIYRTGKIERRKDIIGDKTNEVEMFDIINPDIAFTFYSRAVELFIDRNSAWAYANMLIYFPAHFKDNHALIKEYVDAVESIGNERAIKFLHNSFKDKQKEYGGITLNV